MLKKIAIIIGLMAFSSLVVFAAYTERRGFYVGGEWLLIGAVAVLMLRKEELKESTNGKASADAGTSYADANQ
ncbi:MAG: hypothetical protein RSD88_07455 [Anaerovoracaceae bacterium]